MLRALFQRLQGAVRAEAAAGPPMMQTVAGARHDARRTTLEVSNHLCAVTDIGRAREHNEDLVHVSDDGRIMILADGMGGHAAGEVASALAVAAITEHLNAALGSPIEPSGDALAAAMRAAMDAAQQRVLAAAASPEGKPGMGCTLTLACIDGDTLHTCHVGDVRAYLRREGRFSALTRDHSVVAEMVAAGALSPDEARRHSAKNEVLQAIGMPAGFEPDSNRCALQSGDRVLLCSDGLWEMLPDREIARIAGADGSMRQLATQLVDRANDAGGQDNVSVVLYEHRAPMAWAGRTREPSSWGTIRHTRIDSVLSAWRPDHLAGAGPRMKPVLLQLDLELLGASHPATQTFVDRVRRSVQDAAGVESLLAQIGMAANLGCFRTAALLLKADWEAHERRCRQDATVTGLRNEAGDEVNPHQPPISIDSWRPWEDASRFETHLACFDDRPTALPIELLLLEQVALACHLLGAAQVAELAERHARASALIARAAAAQQQAFAADKSAWLLQELEHEALIDIRRLVVDEIETARMAFLCITGRSYAELVAGAHVLALWRYRLRFNDITLTAEELTLRLAHDLDDAGEGLESDLRLALLDSVQELRDDHQAMRRLALLYSLGQTERASDEELRRAARLFQQLARKIHDDVLTQRDDYASISPQNRRRLKEIWTEASATHRNRVHLSKDKLLNYASHLEAWHVEVDRILRHLSFHSPSRLIEGETLEEMHDDVRRAIAEVQQYLHAVRDDIARLQSDPQHAEYQRVIRLNAGEREAELARMHARAEEWKAEVASIEARMLADAAANAGAEAALLRAKKP